MKTTKAEIRLREETWKLRVLIIVVLILIVVLNPKILECIW